jgi:hypothetical protein
MTMPVTASYFNHVHQSKMQNARRATPFPTHHSNATTSARAVTAVTVTRQAQVVYKMIDRNAGRLLLSMMHLLKHCSHNTIPKPTNNHTNNVNHANGNPQSLHLDSSTHADHSTSTSTTRSY